MQSVFEFYRDLPAKPSDQNGCSLRCVPIPKQPFVLISSGGGFSTKCIGKGCRSRRASACVVASCWRLPASANQVPLRGEAGCCSRFHATVRSDVSFHQKR